MGEAAFVIAQAIAAGGKLPKVAGLFATVAAIGFVAYVAGGLVLLILGAIFALFALAVKGAA